LAGRDQAAVLQHQEYGRICQSDLRRQGEIPSWVACRSVGGCEADLSGKEVYNTTEEVTWGSFAGRIAALSGKDVVSTDVSDEAWKSDEMKQTLGPMYPVFDSIYHTWVPL
jgi:hypothetical protein